MEQNRVQLTRTDKKGTVILSKRFKTLDSALDNLSALLLLARIFDEVVYERQEQLTLMPPYVWNGSDGSNIRIELKLS